MPMFSVAARPETTPQPAAAAPPAPASPAEAPVAVDPTASVAASPAASPDANPAPAAPVTPAPVEGSQAATPAPAPAAPSVATVEVVVDVTDAPLPARATTGAGVTLARPNDGLPMVLDPFAVASRAVLVLIGSIEPAKHIARTAIEMSIEHDSSAAIDVVIPRAIDLVLRRAAHLVSIGAGPKVVDHYTERLELWRRLARRSGLEPAAVVLTLAPFPIPTVASMLRVPLAEVEACIDDWYAGIDPDDNRPRGIAPAPEPVVDLRDHARATQHAPAPTVAGTTVSTHRPRGWARWRLRSA